MKYSLEFKENVVKKVLTGSKVVDVATEAGTSRWRVYQWVKEQRNGGIVADSSNGPRGLLLTHKQALLLESKTIAKDEIGEWLRTKGLCSDHLEKWQKEITDAMNKNSEEKNEIRKLKEENAALQKELKRKNFALAEMTALVALKKKLSYLWEEEEK